MIRLFLGIELPEELVRRMALIQTGVERARWVAEENIHLTLRFIGEVPEDVAADAADALATVHAPPFALTVAGAGHFESRRRVRALWLGVERSDALMTLRERIESALVRGGLEPEGRKFKPHVTIARITNGSPGMARTWLAANTMFRAVPFTVARFTLFSSHLGRDKAIYSPEADFPLSREVTSGRVPV
jgi:2'-5' RNA ligase